MTGRPHQKLEDLLASAHRTVARFFSLWAGRIELEISAGYVFSRVHHVQESQRCGISKTPED